MEVLRLELLRARSETVAETQDEVLEAFDDLNDDTKITYIMIIGGYDIPVLPVIPTLVCLLNDENPDVRNVSKDVFNIILNASDDELRYNIDRLSYNDPSQRYLAAVRLGDFMSLGILALPQLRLVAEKDRNSEVRYAARKSIKAISKLADESGPPVLAAILVFADPQMNHLRGLAVIASIEVEPTEELVKALCNTINEMPRMQRLDILDQGGDDAYGQGQTYGEEKSGARQEDGLGQPLRDLLGYRPLIYIRYAQVAPQHPPRPDEILLPYGPIQPHIGPDAGDILRADVHVQFEVSRRSPGNGVDQGKGDDRNGDKDRNGLHGTTDEKAAHSYSPRFLFGVDQKPGFLALCKKGNIACRALLRAKRDLWQQKPGFFAHDF